MSDELRELDIDELERLGLSDPDDLEEELAEIGRQLPAIIACLKRAKRTEQKLADLEAEVETLAWQLIRYEASGDYLEDFYGHGYVEASSVPLVAAIVRAVREN